MALRRPGGSRAHALGGEGGVFGDDRKKKTRRRRVFISCVVDQMLMQTVKLSAGLACTVAILAGAPGIAVV